MFSCEERTTFVTEAVCKPRLRHFLARGSQTDHLPASHLPQGRLASTKGSYPCFLGRISRIWRYVCGISSRACCTAICSMCLSLTSSQVSWKITARSVSFLNALYFTQVFARYYIIHHAFSRQWERHMHLGIFRRWSACFSGEFYLYHFVLLSPFPRKFSQYSYRTYGHITYTLKWAMSDVSRAEALHRA